MKAKFKIGDVLQSNKKFKSEGKRFFGDNFEYADFKDIVVEVYESTNDKKDGQNDNIGYCVCL